MRTVLLATVCLSLMPPLAAQQPPPPPAPASPAPPAPAPPAAPPAPAAGAPQTLEEVLEALDQGTAASFKQVPFESLLEFYEAQENRTYATVSIAYRPEEMRRAAQGDAAQQLFVRLRGLAPGALRYDFTEPTDFAESGPPGSSGWRVFQTGSALAPGPYRVSVGVWVPGRAIAGGRSEEVVVPNFSSSTLELSSLTLAASVERVSNPDVHLKRPFIWGNFKIVPRVTTVLPRQEPLRLYYQIYNASPDPATGKPRLDITYSFYQKKDGKYLPTGRQPIPNQQNQVAIYELPVDQWPAGDFKIQVQVRDAVSKALATRELLFELR